MARPRLWIGLDVGADNMSVCGTDDQGQVVFEHSLPTKASALHALLKPHKRRIISVALEAGSSGIVLTRSLRKLGYPIVVFDCRQASKFLAIRRNKTDKNDARGLADIGRVGRGSVSEVRVKSPECQRLRSTLVTRRKLVEMRVAIESTMRSLLRLNGGQLKRSSSVAALRRNVSAEVKRIQKVEKIDLAKDIEPLLALNAALRDYLESLDKELNDHAKNDPICRRFLEIPGVGPMCALSFYSAIEEPTRFRRNSDVGAYFGLVPAVHQSGQSMTSRRITKMGDRMTRSYLTTAAVAHIRYGSSFLTTWGERLAKRIGKRRAQVAVARKLAVMMVAMWKSNEPYDAHRGCKAERNIPVDGEVLVAA